jgi:ankyrin repeat protein
VRDFKNRTPLHYAVREGQLEAVNDLLERNADLLSRDDQGYFPLFWACQYHQAEIAKSLIAQAEKTGKLNEMMEMKDNFGWSLLRKAAERGNLEIVTLMKEEMTKAGVLTPEEHQQAVAFTKMNNHSEVVEYLEQAQVSSYALS